MEEQHQAVGQQNPGPTNDEQEAWGIALDLIADLGRFDAVRWADEYMDDLRDDDCDKGVARWSLVTNALAQLTRGTIH